MKDAPEIVIDTDVPFQKNFGGTIFPFREMEVGASFAVPSGMLASRVSTAACQFGRDHKKKFSVRKHGAGHRCWRIA